MFDPKTIVWVANRDSPLNHKNGDFGIAKDGNLTVFNEHKNSVWKTYLPVPLKGMEKLLDFGNLQILSNSMRIIWESFKNPTDTFLQKHIIKKEESSYYWKSGVSGKFISDDILPILSSLLSNPNGSSFDPKTFIENQTNMRLVINSNGELTWWEPNDRCNVFRACGDFASCSNRKNESRCKYLPGFEVPQKMPLCRNKKKAVNFLPLNVIKVGKPDGYFENNNENECKEVCLKECNCQASSGETFTKNRACWIWSDNLYNIQEDDTNGGRKIHLRLQDNISAENQKLIRKTGEAICLYAFMTVRGMSKS
ncbi:hypothetical protein ACOSQ2_002561 [Xanthoceras sorbifolium]